MPRTLGPDDLHAPGPGLPERLPAVIQRELPGLIEEIIEEIRENVPEYARPLAGPYGRALRSGVERNVSAFVEWINDPSEPLDRRDDICRKLGRYEAYEGRQLDSLQSALRIAAQTAWRRVTTLHHRYDLAPATVSMLADALFAYMDELAALALQGYQAAKAERDEELEAARRALLQRIARGGWISAESLTDDAAAAGWTVPEQVTLIAVRLGGPVVRTQLDDDLLADLGGSEPYLLVPGPLTEVRRETLTAALAESRAAAGPTVPLTRAADSLRLARQALDLVNQGLVDDGPLTLCEDHLVTLWLLTDGPLIDQIARRRLAAMDDLTARQRDRLTETLEVWLRTRGTAAAVGAALGVHPQTVRYRMRQIEQILGDELTDPDSRFALEVVLRAWWLRRRAGGATSPGSSLRD